MEEQIRNYVSSARQRLVRPYVRLKSGVMGQMLRHLEDLQGIEQEYRQRERKAMDLVIRLLMKMRSLERRRMRQTTTNITERAPRFRISEALAAEVNTVMPGRFETWSDN